jgi:hypothetical protein
MSGQAFQFVPGVGAVPLETAVSAGNIIGAGDAIAALRAQVDAQEAQRAPGKPPATPASPSAPLSRGRPLVSQIRDRLKVVRAELKALRRLEREEAELKRLLVAAKAPPAPVTHITSARKSG